MGWPGWQEVKEDGEHRQKVEAALRNDGMEFENAALHHTLQLLKSSNKLDDFLDACDEGEPSLKDFIDFGKASIVAFYKRGRPGGSAVPIPRKIGEAPPPQADASRSIVVQQAGGEASESEAEKLKKKAEALKLFAEAKTLMGESTDSISAKIDDLVGDM